MGLFGKRGSREPEPSPGPKPIAEDEISLDTFEEVVITLCSAIETSNAQIDAAIARMRAACGMVDAELTTLTLRAYQEDPGYFDRPGRWLGAGAAKANAHERPELAILAYAWIFMWTTSMEPKLSGANLTVLGLNRTRRDAVDTLIAEAEIALPRVDPDAMLVRTGSGEELTGRMIGSALERHKAFLQNNPGQPGPGS